MSRRSLSVDVCSQAIFASKIGRRDTSFHPRFEARIGLPITLAAHDKRFESGAANAAGAAGRRSGGRERTR